MTPSLSLLPFDAQSPPWSPVFLKSSIDLIRREMSPPSATNHRLQTLQPSPPIAWEKPFPSESMDCKIRSTPVQIVRDLLSSGDDLTVDCQIIRNMLGSGVI
ncbi:hypothetical protein TIFTF001_047721 [Ficus carica]|uniref:Uncharacterized protein n=1 Tax=Ficus carica TaxID=3494 RepID=A0AA87YXN6_FICCA|nr:hypothetical protein TIFTF001_047721 [Ficus carica]